MFGRFFAALRQLTVNTETLAASFAEANQRFRANLVLDGADEQLIALPAPGTEEATGDSGRRNGRGRAKAGI